MPPRWLTLVILIFWLATSVWFVYREIWPYYRPGEPPPLTFGLTDEIGVTALWEVYLHENMIGTAMPDGAGSSQVRRLRDGSFELASDVKFVGFQLHIETSKLPFVDWLLDVRDSPKITVDINKLTNSFTVDAEGKLLRMSGKTVVSFFTPATAEKPIQFDITFAGQVEDGVLTPVLTSSQAYLKPVIEQVPKKAIRVNHNVLNTMHLFDRINGLRDGQAWQVPLFNPTGMLPGITEEMSIPLLEARVIRGELIWDNEPTACWKIEYRQPSKSAVVASTWVRRSDALVLRQEAKHAKANLIFQRQPNQDE